LTQGSPLLAARGAARRFGQTHALEPVELEVWDGEALALVGPKGAGKSTLLSLLAGALGSSAGTIERRKGVRVGWAPQRPAQYGRLSARENLELFARLEGEPDPAAAAERLLVEFELSGKAVPSGNLSVGNRQRLNLAISLLGSPQVLLLDEPTAALDPEQRRRLWARVAALRAGGGPSSSPRRASRRSRASPTASPRCAMAAWSSPAPSANTTALTSRRCLPDASLAGSSAL
jgi:ABC-2 type transport system ATP-binding protein